MSKKQPSAAAPRLKLVVRRLPPNLPEELFWKTVSPWITETTCTWKRYVKGRPAVNPNDHPMHSRAYCLMSSLETLVEFHRGFDGHVFRSKAGVEHQAVVEFAPVQKTPTKAKVKVDARQGTVDEDPDYKSYIQSLTEPSEPLKAEIPPTPTQVESTPLLDHLRAHGSKSSKRKNRSDTSTTDLARSATAAVNAAATKRAVKDSGPVLQAGKGRETVAVPQPTAPTKGKGKSKGKEREVEGGEVPKPKADKGPKKGKGDEGTDRATSQNGETPQQPSIAKANPAHPGKQPAKLKPQGNDARITAGRSGRTTPTQDKPAAAPASPGDKPVRAQGAARGRGRGGKSLAERTRSQVTDVINKNAEAARGGGGGRGRGKRGGQGGSAPGASDTQVQPQILARPTQDPRNARIDT